MRISKKIYRKMCYCNNMQCKLQEIGNEIEQYLENKGIDVESIRFGDIGGYVDMVDYGRGNLSKIELEQLFNKYLKK